MTSAVPQGTRKDMDAGLLMRAGLFAFANPGETNGMFRHLKKLGYRTDFYEPLMKFTSGMQRVPEAVAQGISWNTLPTSYDENNPDNETMEAFGVKFDPYHEAGNVLGGIMGGNLLWKAGAKHIAKPVAKGLQKFIPNGTKIPGLGRPQDVRKAGLMLGRALPEGAVGGVAQGIREEDFDAVIPGIIQWTAIGILGDAVGRKVLKKVMDAKRKKMRGEQLSGQDREALTEAQRVAEQVEAGDGGMLELPPQNRYMDMPDGKLYEVRPDGGQVELPGVVRSQKDADLWVATTASNKGEGLEDVGLLRSAERLEATRISQMRGVFYDELNPLPEHHVRHEVGQVWQQGDRRWFMDLGDIPVEEVDEIAEGVAARYSDGTILLNRNLLKQKWNEKAWTKPRVEGVDPLPENQFKSYAEWEEFVIRHEQLHSVVEGPSLSRKAYDAARAKDLGVNLEVVELEDLSKRSGNLRAAEYEYKHRRLNDDQGTIRRLSYDKDRRSGLITHELAHAIDDKLGIQKGVKSFTKSMDGKIYRQMVEDITEWGGARKVAPIMPAELTQALIQAYARNKKLLTGKYPELAEMLSAKGLDEHVSLLKPYSARAQLENEINQMALARMGAKGLPEGAQTGKQLAPVLAERERFFTYLGGEDEARQAARQMYRETSKKVLQMVESQDMSAIEGAQLLGNSLRELAENKRMYPQGELTMEILGEADEMHLHLMEAVAGGRLSTEEASKLVSVAIETGESPRGLARALRGLSDGGEETVEQLGKVDSAPNVVKRHPLFNQRPELQRPQRQPAPGYEAEKLRRPEMMGGGGPATHQQILTIQEKLADVMNSGTKLDPMAHLPHQLTAEQAQEVIFNLSAEQARRQVMRNDEIMESVLKGTDFDDVRGPLLTEANPPPPHIMLAAADEAAGKQPGVIYRFLGLGAINNPNSGLSANALAKASVRYSQLEFERGQAWKESKREVISKILKLLSPDGNLEGIGRTPARLLREGRRVMSNQPTGEEILTERLHMLGEALDIGVSPKFQQDPQLMEAYQLGRQLFDEAAVDLGMEPGQRITNYLAHIFMGRGGRMRARIMQQRMNVVPELQEEFRELLQGSNLPGRRAELAADVAGSAYEKGEAPARLFGHLQHRSANKEGYEYNFLTVANIYVEGAGDYMTINKIMREGKMAMEMMPESITKTGGRWQWQRDRNAKQLLAEHLHYIAGAPSPGRGWVVDFFTDNQKFNKAVDTMVGYLGAGRHGAQVLQAARSQDPKMVKAADDFLAELAEASRSADRITGKRKPGVGVRGVLKDPGKAKRRMRARTALKIEDLREALTDRNIQAPVVSQIYRVQMMAKLGFNLGFGLVNMTQMATNGWPMLGTEYAAKGVTNFLFGQRRNHVIHGRTVRQILSETGVMDDVAKVEEGIELIGTQGWANKVQRVTMAPGKWSEDFNRGSVALGEYERLMDAGAVHGTAIAQAVEASNKVNFVFNRTGTMPAFRWPMVRLALMFQSYVSHQVDFTSQLVRQAGRGVRDKGLISAAVDGDLDPLMRHMTTYAFLAGVGLPPLLKELDEYLNLPESNVRQRAEHPAASVAKDIFADREGDPSMGPLRRFGPIGLVGKGFSGPFLDTIADLATGQVEEALYGFMVPGTLRRLGEEGVPKDAKGMVKVLGLKKYAPPAKKLKLRKPRGLPRIPSATP